MTKGLSSSRKYSRGIDERERARASEWEGGGGIRSGVDVSGNFFLLRTRDKRRKGMASRESSDDGWSLEFQRTGNHAKTSVYRPSLRNFCLQVGERRALQIGMCDDDDEFKQTRLSSQFRSN